MNLIDDIKNSLASREQAKGDKVRVEVLSAFDSMLLSSPNYTKDPTAYTTNVFYTVLCAMIDKGAYSIDEIRNFTLGRTPIPSVFIERAVVSIQEGNYHTSLNSPHAAKRVLADVISKLDALK